MVTIGLFDPPQQEKGAEALQGTTIRRVQWHKRFVVNLKGVFDKAYIVVRKTPDILDLPKCKISP